MMFEAWVFGLLALDTASESRDKEDEMFITALELSLCSVNIGLPESLMTRIPNLARCMRFSSPMCCFQWPHEQHLCGFW